MNREPHNYVEWENGEDEEVMVQLRCCDGKVWEAKDEYINDDFENNEKTISKEDRY